MGAVIALTCHADQRKAQRGLSEQDIAFVYDYGRAVRCGGALHIFLGKRDLPGDPSLRRRFGRLEGTTLVLKETDTQPILITAYRNRRALKQIRSKTRYQHAS